MTTPNTPGSLAGHKHEWVSDPFRRPFATKACKICGVELEAYVATLEAEKRALEADVIDRENAVAFDAQPEGKPHCIGCGKTEDELHDKDCPHIYGTMQSEGRA